MKDAPPPAKSWDMTTLDNSELGRKAVGQYIDEQIQKQNQPFVTPGVAISFALLAALLGLGLWHFVRSIRSK